MQEPEFLRAYDVIIERSALLLILIGAWGGLVGVVIDADITNNLYKLLGWSFAGAYTMIGALLINNAFHNGPDGLWLIIIAAMITSVFPKQILYIIQKRLIDRISNGKNKRMD